MTGLDSFRAGVGVVCAALAVGGIGLSLTDDGPEPRYAALSPSAPVRLVVPAADIDASVVPVALSADAVLDPPQDPLQVGWWDDSTRPGRLGGQTVITGHTVHTGGGAMDAVDQLLPGQRVDVVTGAGRMRYEVSDVEIIDKQAVAERAQELFGQRGGDGRLVLVSCDDWNGSSYDSNVVVFADPLGQPVRRPKDGGSKQAEAAGSSAATPWSTAWSTAS